MTYLEAMEMQKRITELKQEGFTLIDVTLAWMDSFPDDDSWQSVKNILMAMKN